jgi:hexosaminidase
VAYAYDRGIRVMPEFEMPGHSTSMFVGYPKLASAPGPYKLEPGGPPTAMDPTEEDTYKFLDKFLDEMTKLFPDQYVHIGGDEVDPKPWTTNPKIQEFMHAHGMKEPKDLQAYFNQRVEKILHKHHKTMMGWDEVLHPELPKSIVVQSWRGADSLATAAQQGYSTILSFGYYLDLMWPASRHYAMDPISGAAAALSPEQQRHILGGEACMWSEWIVGENIDSRVWPRNAAIAERLWSPAEIKDVSSMYWRMDGLSWRLQWLGLTHRSSLEMAMRRIAGTDSVQPLQMLASVVEPVKDYVRMDSLKTVWDFRAPLNRLVDFVPPESDTGRQFQEWVQAYLQNRDRAAADHIRSSLGAWRDNNATLQPLLNQSFLGQELEPISTNLSALGSAGLSALDCLEKSSPCTEQWRTQQLAVVEAAKAPKADLLLTVAGPVQQLIEASAQSGRK